MTARPLSPLSIGSIAKRTLIAGFDRGTSASARWQAMAREKLTTMERRIEEAQRIKALLERLLRCRCQTLGDCVRTRTEALWEAGRVTTAADGQCSPV